MFGSFYESLNQVHGPGKLHGLRIPRPKGAPSPFGSGTSWDMESSRPTDSPLGKEENHTELHTCLSAPGSSAMGVPTHSSSGPLKTSPSQPFPCSLQRTHIGQVQRGSISIRTSSSPPSSTPPCPTMPEDDDSSDDEPGQTTQRLMAAVVASEQRHQQKSRHSRAHSWGAPLTRASNFARQAQATSRLSNDLVTTATQQEDSDGPSQPATSGTRVRSSYHLTGHAALELFLRLSRARQTVDFSKRQTVIFSTGSRCVMGVWGALEMLNELREYEAVLLRPQEHTGHPEHGMEDAGSAGTGCGGGNGGLPVDMTLMEHALQTAELCRLHFGPGKEHLHLAGLIHGLGKLLAHARFGSQPQWAVCGESFPLGCRFASTIQGASYFSANADKRRRIYCTPNGIYTPHCGLSNVTMSWGAPEYLHLVLQRSQAIQLPHEALFCLRYQKFFSITAPGATCYTHLLDAQDLAMLPVLRDFQQLCAYKRCPPPGMMNDVNEIHQYYSRLMDKYLPDRLTW